MDDFFFSCRKYECPAELSWYKNSSLVVLMCKLISGCNGWPIGTKVVLSHVIESRVFFKCAILQSGNLLFISLLSGFCLVIKSRSFYSCYTLGRLLLISLSIFWYLVSICLTARHWVFYWSGRIIRQFNVGLFSLAFHIALLSYIVSIMADTESCGSKPEYDGDYKAS